MATRSGAGTRGRSPRIRALPSCSGLWTPGSTSSTANVYSNGSSEEILGSVLLKKVRRDEVVIATKVFGEVRPGPNGRGLSRKAILAEIDNSLRRLGTDYIDLYIIHRWDSSTPIKETLEALHDVVVAGKCATWAPRRCGPGSSPRPCTCRSGTVGTAL